MLHPYVSACLQDWEPKPPAPLRLLTPRPRCHSTFVEGGRRDGPHVIRGGMTYF